jgi:ABC-type multidrug transport system fused ATPase/permease subunit
MQKPSEERQAIRAYNWLRASPFLTIPTLLLISSLDLGESFCDNFLSACNYEFVSYINYTFGVLGSALWHAAILFQYANNKDSAFVRRHGQQALIYAGIRTAVPVIAIVLDYFSSTSGALACVAILILMMLWFSHTKIGLERVKRELEEDSDVTRDEVNTGTQEAFTLPSQEVIHTEVNMSENQSQTAEEILNEILASLKSKKEEDRAAGIARLNDINFSSEAIRRELETIARKDENQSIRANALAALNLPANRMVQRRVTSNTLDRGIRNVLLQEINEWEKSGLLERQNAELIRRRYDFDFDPASIAQDKPPRTALRPQPFGSAQDKPEAKAPEAGTAVPMERREPVPEGPRPSLLQTLTSEASIKIYLYLGAFFVIASAAIIGAAIPELRLPILILGTFIFGGLAVAIKKRLPQPSFALFIVFSFLLPITANTIAGTFNLIGAINAGFWAAVFLVMAGVWSASTWLYESRLFSITAFGSLTLALLRIGDLFEAQPEFFTAMAGIAALAGLGGVWLAKKWKDETFALPLFLSAQLVQGVTLIASISIFAIHVVEPSNPSLWHLAAFFVWGCALAFFILSNRLYPFFAFPWLAAGTLIPMPWFLAAAFDLESLGSTIVLFLWGALLAAASEALHRFERYEDTACPSCWHPCRRLGWESSPASPTRPGLDCSPRLASPSSTPPCTSCARAGGCGRWRCSGSSSPTLRFSTSNSCKAGCLHRLSSPRHQPDPPPARSAIEKGLAGQPCMAAAPAHLRRIVHRGDIHRPAIAGGKRSSRRFLSGAGWLLHRLRACLSQRTARLSPRRVSPAGNHLRAGCLRCGCVAARADRAGGPVFRRRSSPCAQKKAGRSRCATARWRSGHWSRWPRSC